MTHDVFISYSSKDKPVADGVCANLEAAGVRCWIAPRDIAAGEDWPTAITRAIASSHIMVLIFSAHANASEDVGRELFLAADSKLIIIPFKIENVTPEPGKQYYLARTHWLDAMNPPTREQIGLLIDRLGVLLPDRVPPLPVERTSSDDGQGPVIRYGRRWKRLLWIPSALLILALITWAVLTFALKNFPLPSALDATATTTLQKLPTAGAGVEPTAAGMSTPRWDVNIVDGFVSNNSGWPTFSETEDDCSISSLSLDASQLSWDLEAVENDKCWYYFYPELPAVTDFDLTFDVSRSPGTVEAGFGVVFRGDANRGYRFMISTITRSYRVERFSYQSFFTLGLNDEEAILAEGTNRLSVSARGADFSLYINDTLVEVIEDTNLAFGQVGIVAEIFSGEQVSLFFDNFALHGIEKK